MATAQILSNNSIVTIASLLSLRSISITASGIGNIASRIGIPMFRDQPEHTGGLILRAMMFPSISKISRSVIQMCSSLVGIFASESRPGYNHLQLNHQLVRLLPLFLQVIPCDNYPLSHTRKSHKLLFTDVIILRITISMNIATPLNYQKPVSW